MRIAKLLQRPAGIGVALFLTAVAAVGQGAGTPSGVTTLSLGLTGKGSGSGLPGHIDAHLNAGVLTATNSTGGTTSIPLAYVLIYGNSTDTNIVMGAAGSAVDVLNFHDSSASLNDLGRTGTATVVSGGGAFHSATGSLTYTLTCTFVCFSGTGKAVGDIFAFSFSANGSFTLPTTTAQNILPSIVPSPPPPADEAELEAQQSQNELILDATRSIIQNPKPETRKDASQNVEALSLTITPPWEPIASTYSASAVCLNLSASCWVTVPTPAGNIAPFTNAPIKVNLDLSNLAQGVYQSSVAIAVTPSGGTASTQNIPFTLIVGNGPPFLHVSETGIQFQAVTGSPAPAAHTISLSSAATIPYTVTASTLTGGNWLSVSQSTGSVSSSASSQFSISANSVGLAAGSYFGRVDIAAPSASKPLQSVEVELTVASTPGTAPILSTTGVIFVAQQNTNPTPQVVTVSTLSTAPIAISGQASGENLATWLTGSASAATVQAGLPVKETLSVDTKGLAPGVYTGALYEDLTATNTDYPVTVTLVVTPPAISTCFPSQLLPVVTNLGGGFELLTAQPISLAVQIVDDCGNPLLSGAVQASFSTGDAAITMLPTGNGLWTGTWNPHNLGADTVSIGISAQSGSGLQGTASLEGTLDANPKATVVSPGGIVNAASLVSGAPVAPGEFISIFGSNLASSTTSSPSYPYSTSLAGTRVLLSGQPLPLEFVSAGQINALVPYGTATAGLQDLMVEQNGTYSFAESLVVATSSPAVFTQNQSGQGAGVIVVVKPDGTQFEASASQPATAADALVIYCSGLGPVMPTVADGAAASFSPLSNTSSPVTVTIGAQTVTPFFAGLAPGFAGLYQVNVIVPAGVSTGAAVSVVLSTSGFSSPPVTVAIK